MDKETLLDLSFKDDDELDNKKIEPTAPPSPQIGIDTDNNLLYDVINAPSEQIDISKLQSFTNVTRSRNELYDTLDYMAEDTTLASVLETYSEDATETNDNGQIVWCESDDSDVSKYVSFLLKSLNVDKNVFKWTNSLCKYGDVYLRLYRESEVEDSIFNRPGDEVNKKRRTALNEDVVLHGYKLTDRYVHYLEQAPNPAQLFELTRFGKCAGYLKTNVPANNNNQTNLLTNTTDYNLYKFNYMSDDVELFPATEWVHGCLENNCNRTPEVVELFSREDDENGVSYSVRRGESLLYDSYKTWRELMLLENSVLLQRVTQSSIVRVIGVEVGDMPKESVQPHLMNIKQLIEQKAAFNVGKNMSSYTDPGPVINNIYLPTRNNQGVLTTQQIGGDVNIGDLVDLKYYEDKLFGGLRVPKQYFGRTDDAAGFSGGQSLSIISSRYAKMIKRIQTVITQMVTDAINLILIDTNNEQYINRFKIRMMSPTTQEEVDRRDNLSNKIGLVTDIMNSVAEIEDSTIKLKILKSLLSDTINNTEVIALIQEQIDTLESEVEAVTPEDFEDITEEDMMSDEDLSDLYSPSGGSDYDTQMNLGSSPQDIEGADTPSSEDSSNLPLPSELGIGDLSDATNPELV